MSFATDIKTVMNADPSLNSYINGGIHYENLKDNWIGEQSNSTWLVYEFNKSQVDCLNAKNVYTNYTLKAVVIQRDTNDLMETVSNRLIEYLNGYSYNDIIDIGFTNDTHGFNQQQGVYTNTLEFNVIYIEN